MAFTHVQGGVNQQTGSGTIAVTLSAIGSGNTVCGGVSWGDANTTTLSSVTDDKGNTYTIANRAADAVNGQSAASYYLGNITNAPTVITATFSPLVNSIQIFADEYSGALAAANPSDGNSVAAAVQSGSTAADFLSSGNFTTTTNGDLIYGYTMDSNVGVLPSAGTSFTRRTTSTTDVTGATEDRTQSTAGSVAATFTASNTTSRYLTFGIAIKPSAGAGDTLQPQKMVLM